jgi:hypothetical protein
VKSPPAVQQSPLTAKQSAFTFKQSRITAKQLPFTVKQCPQTLKKYAVAAAQSPRAAGQWPEPANFLTKPRCGRSWSIPFTFLRIFSGIVRGAIADWPRTGINSTRSLFGLANAVIGARQATA